MYVYGCFQDNLTRQMMGFEAGASRLVPGILKCRKKEARGDKIFKLLVSYLLFFQCDC